MLNTPSVILLCLSAVVIVAWAHLFHQHWQMASLPMSDMWMLSADISSWQLIDFGWVYSMWAVMMAAMMLPSAIPMFLVFSRICKQRYQTSYHLNLLFILAYLVVWSVFSMVMTGLQWQMHGLHFLSPMMDNQNERLAAAIFIGAGIYQLTSWKSGFLQSCRSPMGFLLTEWREGALGVFYVGLKHGSVCVGCCWAQMLIMFAVGVMNLPGMALITLLVTAEKIVPGKSQLICRIGGVLLIAWGSWLVGAQP
ncbi:DUF2182 domain-containing protein [Nitrosomonas sp. Nm34]|uniref:DUF2182 domain-containing protein n=1 Tax=Nitrosomonas sp. Nm34 TaxID=1881055 RepID=UPI0008E7BB73|nr:DUF2182 domain-containing protein [Nitrosomonas sp. Nm34]SFI38916.1 Predicted metal-binding membrane protein [Nitrosomonas sp. Nm34]